MTTRRGLSTTATSFDIVIALRELDGATLSELCTELDIPKSTMHRHLSTLVDYGFVSVEHGKYHIGFRFLEFGEYARERKEAYRLAKTTVSDLARETGERAQFVVLEKNKGVYVHIDVGKHAVRTGLSVGRQIDLHPTAAGKVILAHLPEERVKELIGRGGLVAKTEATITDVDDLYEQLEETRARGYAFNREENIKGLCAVAGPVTDREGELIGVLSVSGPSNRMKGDWFEHEIPDLILGSANELELRIAYA